MLAGVMEYILGWANYILTKKFNYLCWWEWSKCSKKLNAFKNSILAKLVVINKYACYSILCAHLPYFLPSKI